MLNNSLAKRPKFLTFSNEKYKSFEEIQMVEANIKTNVWQILQIKPTSPAEVAGLKSYTDCIIGTDSVLYESKDSFTLIEARDEAWPLELYVYFFTGKKWNLF